MKIELLSLSGRAFPVENAQLSWTRRELLAAVPGLALESPLQQRQIWLGHRELAEGETLAELGLRDGGDQVQSLSLLLARRPCVLTASLDHTAKLFCAATGGLLRTFYGHHNVVRSSVLSPDESSVLTASDDFSARLWNLAGKCTGTLEHGSAVNSARFSRGGERILTSCDDGKARLWRHGEFAGAFECHGGAMHCAAFSPRDPEVFATASADGTAKLWSAERGELRCFDGHGGEVLSLCFSPDGEVLATACQDGSLRLWSTNTGEFLTGIVAGAAVVSAAFSPDGERVLTGSVDGSAKLWHWRSETCLRSLGAHDDAVSSVAFSADGEKALTASQDDSAMLWDLETGESLRTFEGHINSVLTAVFAP